MSKKAEYIIGSTGGKDYLVIAKHEGLLLGIKAVMEPIMQNNIPKVLVGIRIRVVSDGTANILHVGHYASEKFPGFVFQKTKSPEYCSTFIGSITNPFPDEAKWDQILEILKSSNFIPSMVDMTNPLYSVANILYTKEEIIQFVEVGYATTFNGEEPIVQKYKASVISFPSLMDK